MHISSCMYVYVWLYLIYTSQPTSQSPNHPYIWRMYRCIKDDMGGWETKVTVLCVDLTGSRWLEVCDLIRFCYSFPMAYSDLYETWFKRLLQFLVTVTNQCRRSLEWCLNTNPGNDLTTYLSMSIVCKHCERQKVTDRVNSSPPSAAYMRQWVGSPLAQIMAYPLFGTEPLSKPMLVYCHLDP